MSLRLKLIICVLIALAASTGLIYGVSQRVLIREIESIEADQMKRSVAVANQTIERELRDLDTHLFDLSSWDDTYQYMEQPTQAYIDSNLLDSTYQSLRVNLIAYVKPDGTLLYGRSFDLDKGSGSTVSAELSALWGETGPLLTAAAAGERVTGLVNTRVGTYLLSSRPVLTSADAGPVRGAMVMGRLLSQAMIDSVQAQTHLDITVEVLHPLETSIIPAVPASLPINPLPITVQELDSQTIAGYQAMNDIYGRPALTLQVRVPRLVYQQGKTAVAEYVLIVLAIVAFLGLALNLALSQWILAPLRKLVVQVKGLAAGRGGGAVKRVEAGKGAEFGALASEINHLLNELETAHGEISQLYGQAREQADRDALTGLLSRRAVFDELEARLAFTRDRNGKLAVLMIDIDGFKLFNDTYGHLAGDAVLLITSDAIVGRTREGDLVGRYGGDEILVVLPNTDAEGAVAQAERLLEETNRTTWTAPDGAQVPISLSIGVAAYPSHASELNELLACADANLYAVKQRGRRGVLSQPGEDDIGCRNYGFGLLDSLITALSEKDQYTRRHAEEVATIAVDMAEALGLDEHTVRAIRIAGLVHDVGKTGIPASLLLRPGPLSEEENEVMRRHVDIGVALIRDVPEQEEVLAAVATHHEHLDGSGYPRGLKGNEIPLTGQILAVADTYSALLSYRPYRRAHSTPEAEEVLRSMAGTQLDSRLVEVFLSLHRPPVGSRVDAAPSGTRTESPVNRLAEQGAS